MSRALQLLSRSTKVLELLRDGKTVKEIAAQTGIKRRALEKRIEIMKIATDTSNTTSLVIYAIRNNIINLV